MTMMHVEYTPELQPILINPLKIIYENKGINEEEYEICLISDTLLKTNILRYFNNRYGESFNDIVVNYDLFDNIKFFIVGIPQYNPLNTVILLRNSFFFFRPKIFPQPEKSLRQIVTDFFSSLKIEDEGLTYCGTPVIKIYGTVARYLRKRSLDTVWIPEKQKRGIVERVGKFFSEEGKSFYQKHGFRRKQCHILAGLPGTGKSILVHALASHFNKPIFQVNMGETSPHPLEKIKSSLANSILLIEDIDTCFKGLHHDDTSSKNVVLSSFLNILDGLEGPEEVSIFITCNDTNILNFPAARRGRFNHLELFKGMNKETLTGMIQSYYPDTSSTEILSLADRLLKAKPVIPCDIEHFFMKNPDSFEDFRKDLIEDFSVSSSKFSQFHESVTSMNRSFYPNASSMMTM